MIVFERASQIFVFGLIELRLLLLWILWFGLIFGMVVFLARLLIPSFSVIFLRLFGGEMFGPVLSSPLA